MDEEMRKQIDEEMAAILGPEILARTKAIKENAKPPVTKEDLTKAVAGIGKSDPTEGYPVHVKGLLNEFIKVSQIKPTKRRKSDWIDTANEWREMGVKPDDVQKMYRHAVEGGWDISRPGSITSAYYPMKNKARAEKLVNDKGFRVAK